MTIYKVAHSSDQHLGYSSGKRVNEEGLNLRVLDGYNAFRESIDDILNEDDVDLFIGSGDVFHQAHPEIRTMIEAQDGFRRLSEAGIPVHNITGNHDTTDIRSEIPANRILHEPRNDIYSYVEPYIVKELLPGVYFHFLSHHAYTDQEATIKEIKLIEGAMNILVSHGSTYDTNMNVILHSPQEPREVIIPQDLMDMDWDYTWLGHIHERKWINSTSETSDSNNRRQFYSGSLIRRGFSDGVTDLGRGWTKWIIDTDKKTITPEFHHVKQRPQIDCPRIIATNLTPTEIEEALKAQGKAIFDKYKDEDDTISDEDAPIVRQTVVGLTPLAYVGINWKEAYKYNRHFLTHTLRKIDEAEDKIESITNLDEGELENKNTVDIITAFNDWFDNDTLNEEIEDREEVKNKASDMLKKGQDLVLDDGK